MKPFPSMKGYAMIGINKRKAFSIMAFLTISCLIYGCSPFQKDRSAIKQKEEKAQTLQTGGPSSRYYDFEDILIPDEMKLDKERSFVYETPHIKAGILVFSGRVEVNSLIKFFKENMAKDNWKLLNSFKYKGYMMNFQKPEKSCMILIQDGTFSTYLEIWVGPISKP
jgi:hypothetical protein